DRLERLRAGARAELHDGGGNVVELVDRLHPARELLAFQFVAQVAGEYLVAEQVLALQPLGTDRLHLAEPALGELAALVAVVGRQEVGQAVVVAGAALERGGQRVELEPFFPVAGVERVQPRRRGGRFLRADRGGGGLAAGRAAAGKGHGKGECKQSGGGALAQR